MLIGIDSISFSTSKYFIDLKSLANKYNVDYKKYYAGIGQEKMSIFPMCEDIVTISYDACQRALKNIDDKNSIKFLIFATESGIDASKSAGLYLHQYLELSSDCRVIEVKQACYASTAALQLAKSFIFSDPSAKVLIIGADIARFNIGSPSEYTQGGASVAFVLSAAPKIMTIDDSYFVHTENIMDFWRPNNQKEAIVNGKKSVEQYIKSFDIVFNKFINNHNKHNYITNKNNISTQINNDKIDNLTQTICEKKHLNSIDRMCYHTPFSKMAETVHKKYFNNISLNESLAYIKVIGNCYTASVFLSFISLIENTHEDLSGKNIGMFSFGSGAVSEFFTVKICDGYKNFLFKDIHQKIIQNRFELNYEDYFFLNTFDELKFNNEYMKSYENIGDLKLLKIENGYRIYQHTTNKHTNKK